MKFKMKSVYPPKMGAVRHGEAFVIFPRVIFDGTDNWVVFLEKVKYTEVYMTVKVRGTAGISTIDKWVRKYHA